MSERDVVRRNKRKPKRSINPVVLFQWVVILALLVALIAVSVSKCSPKSEDAPYTSSENSSVQGGENVTSSDLTGYSSNDSSDDTRNASSDKSNDKQNDDSSDKSSDVSSNVIRFDSSETQKWYLRLVNSNVKVSEAEISSVKCTKINSKYTSRSLTFDARAVDALNEMCAAALKDGVKLTISSAYRNYSYQSTLYKNKVAKYTSQGYSKEDAEKVAATIVARPGTSEHNIALAIDFSPIDDTFEKTAQYRWLQTNAEKYGFIQRYKAAKSDITGIVNESWHYRYVTPEHAKRMNELGLCLEEYIDYLKK